MNTFKFTKLKPFKLWAEFQGLAVDKIAQGLKEINKTGSSTIVANSPDTGSKPLKSPVPDSVSF